MNNPGVDLALPRHVMKRNLKKHQLGARTIVVLVSLITGLLSCGVPPKETFRSPILSDVNWQTMVPIVGTFPPTGGSFDGRFETSQFQGYLYSGADSVSIQVDLERTSGSADPVLLMYGPQNELGTWGSVIASDDDSAGDLNATIRADSLARGTYLFVVTTRGQDASGTFRLSLSCLDGCGSDPACPITECDGSVCFSGYAIDDQGCLTCDCMDECGSDDQCAIDEACTRGTCVSTCTCRDAYDPVCGSDGLTYANRCEANCAGVSVLADGQCAPECDPPDCDTSCPSGYQRDELGCETCDCLDPCDACENTVEPVCSLNGRTFQNQCLAECEGEQVLHSGECGCESDETDCECAELECTEECSDGYALDDRGCPTCRCVETCASASGQVCGINGVTYSSECDAVAAGIEVALESPCPPLCHRDDECPTNYACKSGVYELPDCDIANDDCVALCIYTAPSCSDGDAVCLSGDECSVSGSCFSPCDCNPVYYPVCGSNGVTYDNTCRARCESITTYTYGTCCDEDVMTDCGLSCEFGYASDPTGCRLCECAPDPSHSTCSCDSTVVHRVCGADGNWYDNECLMRCSGVDEAASDRDCDASTDSDHG